ncbi:MAG: AzlD domain-containing protein [Oscillospiraceae bacterium]|nr:AzlD domain-containing protein [Oscillospiraceae bacterium]
MKSAIIVGVMAAVSALLRFLPFLVFRKRTSPYVAYLGRVLPPAIIGMLVVYCLKDVTLTAAPYGLPELIACLTVAAVQLWRRSSLWSILAGTAVYLVLVNVVF